MMHVTAAQSAGAQATAAQSFGGTQDFMTLLIAQLQAQDPLAPMDSSEFMSQLADLQSVTELQKISSLLADDAGATISEAAGMIGRTVRWLDANTGAQREAVVDRVSMADGRVELVADDEQIALGDVVSVGD